MLGILVPYRDRQAHLQAFLPHLTTYFERDKIDRDTPYRIIVLEQGNAAPFNRGLLSNIGAALAPDCEVLCFHDVDYLPIWADYRPPAGPTRLIWHGCDVVRLAPGSQRGVQHVYDAFFGAVVMFPRAVFEAVNGYPNDYWGWGYEDSELRARLVAAKIPVHYRDGTFQALPHVNRGYALDTGAPNAVAERNLARFERRIPLLASSPPAGWGGLSTMAFDVASRRTLRSDDRRGYGSVELVRVDFSVPDAELAFARELAAEAASPSG